MPATSRGASLYELVERHQPEFLAAPAASSVPFSVQVLGMAR
jgi:hypothetical protein